jgi:hypothetical protein
MKIRSCILACLLSTSFVCAVQAQTVPPEAADTPQLEADALAVLKGLAEYLTAAGEFSYQAETSYDVVQDSGAKVEFGASRKIMVSRPNRLRIEVTRRDGAHSIVVFDGENVWVSAPEHNVYAKAGQRGDLDEAIQFAVTQLHLKAPLTDLISPDFYEHVTENMTGAVYLGETVLTGQTCDHLLLSNDYTDFQLWITTGSKPVLRRIVITYREEPGEPQFRAHFLKWDMSPPSTTGKFTFKPSADAERIRFYTKAPAVDQGQGDES